MSDQDTQTTSQGVQTQTKPSADWNGALLVAAPPARQSVQKKPDWNGHAEERYERELSELNESCNRQRRNGIVLIVVGVVCIVFISGVYVSVMNSCQNYAPATAFQVLSAPTGFSLAPYGLNFSLDPNSLNPSVAPPQIIYQPVTPKDIGNVSYFILCLQNKYGYSGLVIYLLLLAFSFGFFFLGVWLFFDANRRYGISQEILEKQYQIYANLTPELSLSSYFSNLTTINRDNLEKYYHQVQIHADRSFRASLIAGVAGFLLIVAGLVFGVIAIGEEGTSAATLSFVTAGAGVITEFISAIFFYLYNKTVRQMKDYHDTLIHAQNVFLSLRTAEELRDQPEDRVRLLEIIINYLTRPEEKDSKETKG